MYSITLMFVVGLTLLFIAVVITNMIMKPIKQKREDRRWAQWKQDNNFLSHSA